jgi:general secretion pathway protein G
MTFPDVAAARPTPTVLQRRRRGGFTIVELLISLLIVGILVSIAYPAYNRYQEKIRVRTAVQDIAILSALVKAHADVHGEYPATLGAATGGTPKADPWGRPYQYLNFALPGARGLARKDHALVPINSDFDLYSLGPDGRSSPPLTASHSRDDIVRANDGRYIGVASEY